MAVGITDRLFGENSSVAIKAPVIAVSNANIPLSGLATIPTPNGGYTPNSGDRILAIAQNDPTQNGIYNASTAAWTRSGDFDGANDVVQGTLVIAQGGVGLLYQLTTANPVIGTTPLNFSSFWQPNNAIYPQTTAEAAAGVAPTNYGYPAGNVLRYGADPTGVADSTAAFNAAALSSLSPITAPTAYKTVYVPAGQYKLTSTVYVPAGTILHGDGMSSYIDASSGFSGGTVDVFKLGWSLVAGVPTKDTIYLTGGYPPEIYGLFVNGGPASASVVDITYPGALCHDIWFSAPGQAVYLAGGYLYDCEVDGGLTGMTIGPATNQTVNNVRFFNQNVAINFDTGSGDISDCIFSCCTIEYPKIVGVQIGGGSVNIRGIKFVGCDFINNPISTVTNFSNCVSVGLANCQLELDACTFHNWGRYGAASSYYALLVQAAGAVVDVKGCIFDGAPTNATYTASSNAAAMQLNQGTLRITDTQIRNLPATYGIGIAYGGASANVLQIDGLTYSSIGGPTVLSITNSNASSVLRAAQVTGDGLTPFMNAQGTVATGGIKGARDWFGAIGTSGSKNYVTVPYQASSVYQVTLTVNINSGGSGANRKSVCFFIEKDNDYTGSAFESYLTTAVAVQGAAEFYGQVSFAAEFGVVGGGTSIAQSNSGQIAISWPTTYSFVSVDAQLIASG